MRIVGYEQGTGYLCTRDTLAGQFSRNQLGFSAATAASQAAALSVSAAKSVPTVGLWSQIADVGLTAVASALPAFMAVVGAEDAAKRANSEAAAAYAAQLRSAGIAAQQQAAQQQAVAQQQAIVAQGTQRTMVTGAALIAGLGALGLAGYVVYRIAKGEK